MTFSCHHDFAVSWCPNTSVAYAYCFNGLEKPQKHKLNIPYPLFVTVRKAGNKAGIAYCDRSGTICHITLSLSSSSETKTQEKVLACISDDIQGIAYCIDGIAVLCSRGVYYIYPKGKSVGVQEVISWDESKRGYLLSSDNFIAIVEEKPGRTKTVSVYELCGREQKEAVKRSEITATGEVCLCGKHLAEVDGMYIRVFTEEVCVERKWMAAGTIGEKIWWTNGELVIISAIAEGSHFFLVLPVENGRGGWGRSVGPYLEAVAVNASSKHLYCLAQDYVWGWDLEFRNGELISSSKRAASFVSWTRNENEIIHRAEQGDFVFADNALARIVLTNSDCEMASVAMMYSN